jgi:hypothetical protein
VCAAYTRLLHQYTASDVDLEVQLETDEEDEDFGDPLDKVTKYRPTAVYNRWFRVFDLGSKARMMMILHQVRRRRQDAYATNHVRCAETSRAKQSRKHIEAKHSETIHLSIMCQWSTTPAKQSTDKAPGKCSLGKHNL